MHWINNTFSSQIIRYQCLSWPPLPCLIQTHKVYVTSVEFRHKNRVAIGLGKHRLHLDNFRNKTSMVRHLTFVFKQDVNFRSPRWTLCDLPLNPDFHLSWDFLAICRVLQLFRSPHTDGNGVYIIATGKLASHQDRRGCDWALVSVDLGMTTSQNEQGS